MEKIFLNGKYVYSGQALMHVEDRAVIYGDSVFDTLRSYNGRPFRLDRHLERLFDSCRTLRISPPMNKDEITEAITGLLNENGLGTGCDARIRITITGGTSSGPKGLDRPGPLNLFITAKPYEPPAEHYENGIGIIVSSYKKNSSSRLSGMKTGNILDLMIARQDAVSRGADDAVLLSTGGNISEATSSNIFMVKNGKLLTPDVGCALLPGVTREAVIELCRPLEIECEAIMAGSELLLSSDELFLTNSMVEILPVRSAGSKVFSPVPGPLTRRIMEAYRDLVIRETH
ncbi:MAG: aminotransferase class IV [Actinobacteria bacterium]|nr:aminotransferase class IV [Actinomycetota bacterium]